MPSTQRQNGPQYWRSLDELADSPQFRKFVEAEFPALKSAFAGPSRRQFLKVMGSSLALAGLTGCRWPRERIVPATKQPGDRIPGEPVQYATSWELAGVGTGLLVTSYDGRPIKIEGNDKHPFSRGKTSGLMQAVILDLYDPDRSAAPVRRPASTVGGAPTWADFETFANTHFGALRNQGGRGLAILSEASLSPSFLAMRAEFAKTFPQARWFTYEPLSRTNEIAGTQLAFGQPVRPQLTLDQTAVIVSLDADFLVAHPAAVRYAGDFAKTRKAEDGRMSRLYVFESDLSVTGTNADARYAVRSSAIGAVLARLAHEVGQRLGNSALAALAAAGDLKLAPQVFTQVAEDLVAHKGQSVIVVGPQQPPAVHALAHQLNVALGAVGHTVYYTQEPEADFAGDDLAALVEALSAGQVDTLVMLGANPAYSAPAALDFAATLKRAKTAIHLSQYDNETSQLCHWHLPQAHFLEAWGDTQAFDGTVALTQPLIEPLYGGRTASELLALLCGNKVQGGYDIVRQNFFGSAKITDEAQREQAWNDALHAGVVADTAWPKIDVTASGNLPAIPAPLTDSYEVVLRGDYSTYDGRFANNSWLQEWPDPITKLTWDNAALMAPADARQLGVQQGDLVNIAMGPATLKLPVAIVPGHAIGAVTLPLGYGRPEIAGKVAGGVGFDTYRLLPKEALQGQYIVPLTGRFVRSAGKHKLVTTQDHHAIKSAVGDAEIESRVPQLVREITLAEFQHDPHHAQHLVHHLPLVSLWQEKPYEDGHKWGMAIDLSTCTGCGGCTLACQAENNVPVVGKDEVAMGREMHWLRVDRYFKGAPEADDVRVVHQPVACVHCENAPCEQVCPVGATVHDTEGLNVMVYNRCVGTRYCSNNCPYKVRRFNWFYNHHGPKHPRSLKADEVKQQDGVNIFPLEMKKEPLTAIEKLLNNPEVTVRSRGVMEKCTYCVQRINKAKVEYRNAALRDGAPHDRIPDGAITPACAQACPTNAIAFGDLNDPNSAVSKLRTDPRAYAMLAELNVKPRTTYLAKLRNVASEK